MSQTRQGSWTLHTAMALAILASAVALRSLELGGKSLWMDEIATVIDARSGAELLSYRISWDHPPLFFLLVTPFVRLWDAEWAPRVVSALSGSLAVLVIYWLGRHLLGRRAALLAGVFLAISPFAIYYSQEARPCAMASLLATVAVLTWHNAIKLGGAGRWLLFGACAALLAYTSYLACLVLVVLALGTAVVCAARRASWKDWGIAAGGFGLCGVLYLPWLPQVQAFLLRSLEGAPRAVTPAALWRVFHQLMSLFPDAGPELAALTCALLVLGVLSGFLRRRSATLLLAAWFAAPFLFLILFPPRRWIHPRHLLFALPPLCCLAAEGVSFLGGALATLARRPAAARGARPSFKRAIGAAAFLAVCAPLAVPWSMTLARYYAGEKQNYRDAARYVQENSWPGDAVVIGSFDGVVLEHYFSKAYLSSYQARPASAQDWEELVGSHRVWYIYSFPSVTSVRDKVSYTYARSHLRKRAEFPALQPDLAVTVLRSELGPDQEVVASRASWAAFLQEERGQRWLQAQPNLVRNGAFEAGSEGWLAFAAGPSARLSVDSADCYEGAQCARVSNASPGYAGGWYQRIDLAGHHAYAYACRLRAVEDQQWKGRALYWETQAEGVPQGHWTSEWGGSFDWNPYLAVLVVDDPTEAVILPVTAEGMGSVWIDDVQIVDLGVVSE